MTLNAVSIPAVKASLDRIANCFYFATICTFFGYKPNPRSGKFAEFIEITHQGMEIDEMPVV